MKRLLPILIAITVTAVLMFSQLCFAGITGAVRYDDPLVPKEVNTLRRFRDFHLKKYSAGKKFIKYYYKYGPVAAKAIEKRERLKSLVRLSLLPLMYAGRNFDGVLNFFKIFTLFLVVILLWYIYLKAKRMPVKTNNPLLF